VKVRERKDTVYRAGQGREGPKDEKFPFWSTTINRAIVFVWIYLCSRQPYH